jgi:D-sedoheptulose 7-phosphate isomerase
MQGAERQEEFEMPTRAKKSGPGATPVRTIAQGYFDYVTQLIRSVDMDKLDAVVQRLREAREGGSCVYVMGNGGSAATASHFANDLGKLPRKAGQAPIRAVSLTDNVAWVTALANDEGYENIFTGQLDRLLQNGDVVIVISASGNSTNLVRAVELAKQRGADTIAVLGFTGGKLRGMADIALLIPSRPGYYGPVEDVHLVIEHVITDCLARF